MSRLEEAEEEARIARIAVRVLQGGEIEDRADFLAASAYLDRMTDVPRPVRKREDLLRGLSLELHSDVYADVKHTIDAWHDRRKKIEATLKELRGAAHELRLAGEQLTWQMSDEQIALTGWGRAEDQYDAILNRDEEVN